jgi:hypothetical protein
MPRAGSLEATIRERQGFFESVFWLLGGLSRLETTIRERQAFF